MGFRVIIALRDGEIKAKCSSREVVQHLISCIYSETENVKDGDIMVWCGTVDMTDAFIDKPEGRSVRHETTWMVPYED